MSVKDTLRPCFKSRLANHLNRHSVYDSQAERNMSSNCYTAKRGATDTQLHVQERQTASS
jgi:hypothetical protein